MEALEADVVARFGLRRAVATSTGRAGLTLLFRAMRRLAPAHRDEVVLPAYTCYSVAASAVKAGLRVRLTDVDPDTLDYAPAALDATPFDRVLAMVATNLYGLPGNMPSLTARARAEGVFLVDDAAQALGATMDGRPSGTWGDAGLFSFDKGKNISAIDGGIVGTRSGEVADALAQEALTLPDPARAQVMREVVKAVGYWAMLRPWLYGIPARIPQLELGRTVFTTEFPIARPSPALAALARVMLARLEAFTAARVANAQRLRDGLAAVPGLRPISVPSSAVPAYLRLPMLARDERQRDRLLVRLTSAGIGATASYPASLADVPALRPALAGVTPADARGGREVAARIFTLPTHPLVKPADVRRIVDVVSRSLDA